MDMNVLTKVVKDNFMMTTDGKFITDSEKDVAQKILEILKESDISVVRATNLLNFCSRAIQFTKMI